MIITQNGKPAGVLLTTEDYKELIYQKSLMKSISHGISDLEKGNIFTTEQLRAELEKRRL